jgi:RHS repeat-associated protein
MYNGWQCVADLNSSKAIQWSYAWGLDLSGSRTGAGGVGGLLWVRKHTGSDTGRYFAAYDGNGNVVALYNQSGAIVARYEYGPFGEALRVTATHSVGGANPWRWSTKRTDPTTDLVHYEYRVYDPGAGRWISRDPIGEPGGLNLYSVVRNDSVNHVDILGLCVLGKKSDPKCEIIVLPWGHTPVSEHAADAAQQFMNIVGTVDELSKIAGLMISGLGKGVDAALHNLQPLLVESGYPATDTDAIMTLARNAARKVRGRFGGYFLYTRIKYKECVCKYDFIFYSVNGNVEMPKDKEAGWKQWGYTQRDVDGPNPFASELHAMRDAAASCAKHLTEWKTENE